MHALLRRFVDLCLFRAGPQDLPASEYLLWLSIMAYLLTGLFFLSVAGQPLGVALAEVALDATVLLGLIRFSLLSKGLSERWLQTASAALGSGALLQFVVTPVYQWLGQASQTGSGGEAPAVLLLVTTGWSLAVLANILRQALSTPMTMGYLLALGYLFLSLFVAGLVLPG